jgi:hypothetical protein
VPYHVFVTPRKPEDKRAGEALALDKDAAWVEECVVQHWRQGSAIFIDGRTFAPDDIEKILITKTTRSTRSSRWLMTDARKTPEGPLPPGQEIVRGGQDVTDQFITGPPGTSLSTDAAKATTFAANRKAVMVIYGHDIEANNALFGWLRAVGLQPQEWSQLVSSSGSASPYIGDVLVHAFQQAQAVVALFTPDERVRPRGHREGPWRLQARPTSSSKPAWHSSRTPPGPCLSLSALRNFPATSQAATTSGSATLPSARSTIWPAAWKPPAATSTRLAPTGSILPDPRPRQHPAFPSPTQDATLGTT